MYFLCRICAILSRFRVSVSPHSVAFSIGLLICASAFLGNAQASGLAKTTNLTEPLTFQSHVEGLPEADKQVTLNLQIHELDAEVLGASQAYMRVFSDIGTYRDIYLLPVDAAGSPLPRGTLSTFLAGTFTLSKYARAGTWQINDIILTDHLSLNHTVNANGADWSFQIDNALEDLTSATYVHNSAVLTRSLGTVEGQQVQIIRASWQVDESIGMRDPDGCYVILNDTLEQTYRFEGWGSYDTINHLCNVDIIMPHFRPTSSYSLDTLYMVDAALNYQSFSFGNGETAPTIDLVTNNQDIIQPELDVNDFLVETQPSNPQTPDGETRVTFTYKVRDNISGLRIGGLYLRDPQGNDHHHWAYNSATYDVFPPDDPSNWHTYTHQMIQPLTSIAGTWFVARMTLLDRAGNYIDYDLGTQYPFEIPDSNAPDTLPPEVSAPTDITLTTNNPSGTPTSNTSIQTFLVAASAIDVIDGTLPVTHNAPTTFPVGTTTVIFIATDTAGNIGSATSTVTVNFVDIDAPVVSVPTAVTLITNEQTGLPASNNNIVAFLAEASATDTVDGTLTVAHNAPATFPVGSTTIIFSATDAAGNAGTATSTVTVNFVDAAAPVIAVPTAINLTTNEQTGLPASNNSIATFLAEASATDVVDGTLTVAHNAPTTFPVGTTTIIFSATDAAGNTGTATSTITVNFVDAAAPVITAPTAISLTTNEQTGLLASNNNILAFLAEASATDEVDGTLTVSHNAPATFPVGTTTITFSATDAAGNTGTATSTTTINFVDAAAPIITAPTAISLITNEQTGLPASNSNIVAFLTEASATDEVDGSLTVSHNAPTTFPVGTTTVSFNATDAAGNTGTATSIITVNFVDASEPIIAPPTSISLITNEQTGLPTSNNDIVSFLAEASATDAVDGTLTVSHTAPTTFPVGTTTVIFSATDAAGNTGTATSTITVNFVDAAAPIITVPTSISLIANEQTGLPTSNNNIVAFLAGASATDAVDGTLIVSHNAPTTFPVGTTTVTFSATDTAGNTGSAASTITVNFVDASAPVITVPAAISLTTNDQTGLPQSNSSIVAFLAGASANDAVDGPLTTSHNAPVTFPLGTTTITFSATDAAGNTGTETSTITINFVDAGAPTITVPAAISLTTEDRFGLSASNNSSIVAFLAAATATDVIDGALTVSHNAPTIFPVGTTTVTFSASDTSGNTGTATSTITVNFVDARAPVITVPAAISLTTNDQSGLSVSNNSIVAFLTGASATDVIDGTLTVSHNAPTTFPVGTTSIIFSATDAAGNTGTETSTVTVNFVDAGAPEVTVPAAISLITNDQSGLSASNNSIVVFLAGASATDAIDGALTVSHNAPANFPVGTTTVTFSASDAAGNTDTATSSVTVNFVDTDAPIITVPAAISLTTNDQSGLPASHSSIVAFLAGASATDTIDGTLTVNHNAPTNFPVGTTTVTFSATDTAGNTGTATSTITVNLDDVQAPVLTVPAAITLTTSDQSGLPANNPDIQIFLTAATATDAVDGSLPVSHNAAPNFPVGRTQIIFSATDLAGNTTTETSTVTVEFSDIVPPVILENPQIINITHQSAVIRWHTDEAASAVIEYGLSVDNLDQIEQASSFNTQHNMTLTRLTAGTLYYYRVGNSDENGNQNNYSDILNFTTDARNGNNNNDEDNDGIPDDTDNCPSISNTDQQNTDGANDGGDACDTDDDNDGVLDVDDAFPLDATKSAHKLINDLSFNDANLSSCILTVASTFGWTTVNEMTELDCSGQNISDINGLEGLFNLTTLWLANNQISDIAALFHLRAATQIDLSGNNAINCTTLDVLVAALGEKTTVTRPTTCDDSKPLIADITFADTNLATCVLDTAKTNGWTTASEMTTLNCQAQGIESLMGMANLSALTHLDLRQNSLSDLAPLVNLTALTELKLAKNSFNNLAPLSNMAALTFLSLSSNAFDEVMLNNLANLTELHTLYLRDNQISDISPLAQLTNLTHLYLSDNQIVDSLPLAQMTTLTHLYALNNNIADITALADLRALKVVRLNNNYINDITALFNLTQASNINLSGNNDINCAELETLTSTLGAGIVIRPGSCISLADAVFSDANLQDCVVKTAAKNDWTTVDQMTTLDCQSDKISDLTGIDFLSALTTLDLRKNDLTSTKPLANLSALTELKLAKNTISDLTGLKNLTALSFLSISDNTFESAQLSALSNLNQLNTLYLRDNQITDVSSLASLTNLTKLYLRNNQLVDITPLASLTNLSVLRLNNNQISDITPLLGLTVADDINLSGNNDISCADLDALVVALGEGIVTRVGNCTP